MFANFCIFLGVHPIPDDWIPIFTGVPYFQNPFVVAICCNFSDLLHQWFQGSQPPPWPIWPRGDVPVFALQHPPPRDRPRQYVVETCLSLFGGIPSELVHLYISMRILNLNKSWGYIYKYIYIYIYLYVYAYIYIYTYIYMHIYIHIYMHINTYIFTYIYMHIYIFTYIYIYAHIYIYIRIYIYMNTYIYIHIYIYTYTSINIIVHNDTCI